MFRARDYHRTAGFDDHGVVVRSTDRGQSWQPWRDMGVVGHPYHALRLPDNRVFLVYGVESGHVRGAHAHRTCAQFLVAAHGSVSVVVDDGSQRVEVRLVDQTMGLYLPPMIWGIQFKYAPDSVLMVLASHLYQADDYLRDYDEFCRLVARPE
jgi:hypothetical protein